MKLFSILLTRRLMGTVKLHNRHYAFKPGIAPMNALHTVAELT